MLSFVHYYVVPITALIYLFDLKQSEGLAGYVG
jgi:hypothetical protein